MKILLHNALLASCVLVGEINGAVGETNTRLIRDKGMYSWDRHADVNELKVYVVCPLETRH